MLQYFKKPAKQSAEKTTENEKPDTQIPVPTSVVNAQDVPLPEDTHPVLSDEDESFLLRVASEADPRPLPPRPASSASAATPEVAAGETEEPRVGTEVPKAGESSRANDAKRWAERWVEWGIKPTQDLALQKIQEITDARHAASLERQKASDRKSAADTLKAAADSVKTQTKAETPADAEEAKEESKEMGNILSRLDLSSINNRVVGVSKETQKLLEAFNQVLKDIVNGVPTAYGDLEKLLTERQSQLEKLYGGLPPFMQGLVKTIPVKVYAMLAPQVAAAMSAEEAKVKASSGGKAKKKKRTWIPSLKSLIGQKGAVAAMLRSIIGFLEMRFPALLAGTNVIVSLAVFILLFVFWYCHKRGRETRLAKSQGGEGVEDEGDDSSLSDLEKGPDLEESQNLSLADSPPRDVKALPAVDDADIERNVDALMAQLERPVETKEKA